MSWQEADVADKMVLETRRFAPGELILRPGQKCEGLYLLEEGKVEVFRQPLDRKIVVSVLGKGDVFGEMALIGETDHIRYVAAVDDVSCLFLTKAQYHELFEASPALIRVLLKRIIRKLRRTTDIAFGKDH
jgi:CRP-like cAMP-binding protein